MDIQIIILGSGVLALVYGVLTGMQVMSASPGNERMCEIAAAIREGANAYLNRQYATIGAVGIVVAAILTWTLGVQVGSGFAIGAILSGAAGYIGMNVSVRANSRTAEAARKSINEALGIAFKSGAITGILFLPSVQRNADTRYYRSSCWTWFRGIAYLDFRASWRRNIHQGCGCWC